MEAQRRQKVAQVVDEFAPVLAFNDSRIVRSGEYLNDYGKYMEMAIVDGQINSKWAIRNSYIKSPSVFVLLKQQTTLKPGIIR